MAEQVYLYSYVPPLGENIPVSVKPFPVYYLVPTEDEIKWAVTQLRNHHTRVPSRIWSKHLKGWLAAAREKGREEAVADQENPTEGMMTAGLDRLGGKVRRRSGRRHLWRFPIG